VGPVPGSAAAQVLATLAVKGLAPMTDYRRDQFGSSWADTDHNGCDQRNDVLARDLTDVVFAPKITRCVVLSGTLHDPYTDRTIAFLRGPATSAQVQIDHVVSLGDAWQTGARQWDPATRERFANDLLNLLATAGSANQAKGDADAASWLPPVRGYRCAYVARQVAVKARYHLWATAAERSAIAGILDGCPGQLLPTE